MVFIRSGNPVVFIRKQQCLFAFQGANHPKQRLYLLHIKSCSCFTKETFANNDYISSPVRVSQREPLRTTIIFITYQVL